MLKWRACIVLSLFCLAIAQLSHAVEKNRVFDLHIPPSVASIALMSLARQTEHSILFQNTEIDVVKTKTLKGRFTLIQALNALLKGTNLSGSLTEKGVITVSLLSKEQIIELEENMKSNYKITLLGSVASIFTTFFSGSSAIAEDKAAQSPDPFDEIVVTAQRRAQSIQDVGISVTAFLGEDIREIGISRSTEIILQTPGVEVNNRQGPGTNANISIRGIGLNEFNDGFEAPVVTYLDEFYLVPYATVDFSLYDIERVEILRGPQGTQFGRNATGGLIHYITAKPTDELSGFGEFTVAEHNQLKFEGAIGGPLADKLSARLSVEVNKQDGYVRNLTRNEDTWERNGFSTRLQLLFQPAENVELLIKGEHAEFNGNSYAFDFLPAQVNAVTGDVELLPPGTPNRHGFLPDNNPDTVTTNDPTFLDTSTDIFTARLDWQFDSFTFDSITGYLSFNKFLNEDADGQPLTFVRNGVKVDTEQFSQEFRFSGSTENKRWQAGAYFLNYVVNGANDSLLDLPGLNAVTFFGPKVLENRWSLDTFSWSAFGEAEWDFGSDFTLITGLRYTKDIKKVNMVERLFVPAPGAPGVEPFGGKNGLNYQPLIVFAGMNLTRDGAPVALDTNFDGVPDTFLQPVGDLAKNTYGNFAGKIQLEWHPNDDLLLYGGVTRGHKAGGFINGIIFPVPVELASFDQEVIHNFEVGFKSTVFNGNTRINGSVFHYIYDNFQSFSIAMGIAGTTTNLDASATGAELEVISNPIEGLLLNFGISVLDSKVEGVTFALPGGGSVSRNTELGLAPHFTFNGRVRYEWPAFNGSLAIMSDFAYVGERFLDSQNNSADIQPAYFLANGKISYTSEDAHWTVAVFVKNLFDNRTRINGFAVEGVCGCTDKVFLPPRWVGATLTFRL